jgi:hypothetical protein
MLATDIMCSRPLSTPETHVAPHDALTSEMVESPIWDSSTPDNLSFPLLTMLKMLVIEQYSATLVPAIV